MQDILQRIHKRYCLKLNQCTETERYWRCFILNYPKHLFPLLALKKKKEKVFINTFQMTWMLISIYMCYANVCLGRVLVFLSLHCLENQKGNICFRKDVRRCPLTWLNVFLNEIRTWFSSLFLWKQEGIFYWLIWTGGTGQFSDPVILRKNSTFNSAVEIQMRLCKSIYPSRFIYIVT